MTAGAYSRVVLISVALTTGMACSDSLHLGAEAPSPSGRYIASFFGISGGGAVGWARQYVGIRQADNAFDRRDHVLEMTRGYEVCLMWQSDTKLIVEYPEESELLSFEHDLVLDQQLKVEYQSRPSSGGKLREPACAGCLAQIGAANSPWSPCAESEPRKQWAHVTAARDRK